jgi:succinate dehydrogenase/fumarate reductase cytochrome b subunit (b558 family)
VAADAVERETSRLAWVLRALHSLTGLVPVAVFMLAELWTYAKALDGPDALAAALERRAGLGWQLAVLVPLAYHAAFGLVLALRTRYSVRRYPSSRNWTYTLQRVTGILAFAFIAWHMGRFWLPLQRGTLGPAEVHPRLVEALSSTGAGGVPWTALGYALGLGACAFHLGVGVETFAIRWGLAPSRRAQTIAGIGGVLVGLGTLALGGVTLVYLATGHRLVGEPPAPRPQSSCDVAPSSTAPVPEPPR